MIVVYNEKCSKCIGLNHALEEANVDWNALKYLEGDLSKEAVDEIFDKYTGDISDLIRPREQAWVDSGNDIDTISLDDLKKFILDNPIVLQRPIVIQDGKVSVARSPDIIEQILAGQ